MEPKDDASIALTANDLNLDLDAFIRSIGINRATQHALLLGAGASISSGVPSAASCIWEWKRAIFLTRNPGLEAQFAELSLPAVRSKIQRWLDGQAIYPRMKLPKNMASTSRSAIQSQMTEGPSFRKRCARRFRISGIASR